MEKYCQEYEFLILAQNNSLTDLAKDKRLQLHLCRTIAYILLRSNSIKTNVRIVVSFANYAITIDGRKVKGLRVDDDSCIGFVRALLRKGRMPGAEIILSSKPLFEESKVCKWTEIIYGKEETCCNIIFDDFPLLKINDKNIYTWYIGAAMAILLEGGYWHGR